MKTIYKYRLMHVSEQVLEIPFDLDASDIGIGIDLPNLVKAGWDPAGSLSLWCRIDTDAPKRCITVQIIGTGLEFPGYGYPGDWLATLNEGRFVWHVFAKCGGAPT